MKTISRSIATAAGAGLLIAMSIPTAFGCVNTAGLQGPFTFASSEAQTEPATPAAKTINAFNRSASEPSIAGMWSLQLVSQGNTTHNPSIPDGAVLDYGFQFWHSDNTEWENSGSRTPNTQNFCEGVWGQTGFSTYELNHFAFQYDGPTQILTGTVNIRYQVTLSPSGDSFSGTFTIDVYDKLANHIDHLAGNVHATRVTVDTVVTAVP